MSGSSIFPSCQSFPAIDEESHILYLVDNSVENETNAMSGTRAAIARVIIVIRNEYAEPPGSNFGNRHFINFVSVLVHDGDEPVGPVPARHDRAMLEVARERQSICASGGVAR